MDKHIFTVNTFLIQVSTAVHKKYLTLWVNCAEPVYSLCTSVWKSLTCTQSSYKRVVCLGISRWMNTVYRQFVHRYFSYLPKIHPTALYTSSTEPTITTTFIYNNKTY